MFPSLGSQPGVETEAALQEEIDLGVRAILVNWLFLISDKVLLQDSTIHIAVQLMDKVLGLLPVEKVKFQVIGAACLSLASKIEEIEVSPVCKRWTHILAMMLYYSKGYRGRGMIADLFPSYTDSPCFNPLPALSRSHWLH